MGFNHALILFYHIKDTPSITLEFSNHGLLIIIEMIATYKFIYDP